MTRLDVLAGFVLCSILEVLRDVAAGTIVAVPRDDGRATWEPSWERQPSSADDCCPRPVHTSHVDTIGDQDPIWAAKRFWGWKRALEDAGIDYADITRLNCPTL